MPPCTLLQVTMAFAPDGCHEQVPARGTGEIGLHGAATRFSIRNEEVTLRIKASPACLECKDHAATTSDGVCHIKVELFTLHPARSEWADKSFTLC